MDGIIHRTQRQDRIRHVDIALVIIKLTCFRHALSSPEVRKAPGANVLITDLDWGGARSVNGLASEEFHL